MNLLDENVPESQVAALNTQAKRMGAVVRASDTGVRIWRRNEEEQALPWP